MTSRPSRAPDALAQEFVRFSVEVGALRFGEFRTKAGRLSPYFFNAGGFDDGAKLGRLASFYARRLIDSGLAFDMLFGPAYKGIVLAASVAIELARLGRNVPYAYNRKEAKDHGEGGSLVGAPLDESLGARLRAEHLAPLAPIDDPRGTAAYRREAAQILVARCLNMLGSPA